jgi:WLM domain
MAFALFNDATTTPSFLGTTVLLGSAFLVVGLKIACGLFSRLQSQFLPKKSVEEMRLAQQLAGLSAEARRQRKQHQLRTQQGKKKAPIQRYRRKSIHAASKSPSAKNKDQDCGKRTGVQRDEGGPKPGCATNASRVNVEESDEETSTQELIRKAALEDQMKWDEDRDSQCGGFNIYGHQTDYCQECGVDQTYKPGSRGGAIQTIVNMPHLPIADVALSLLQNLAKEFEPVIAARGWKVVKLSEMCCCGDGDETLDDPSLRTSTHHADTVLGYCVSSQNGRTALGIHIRLRPPGACRRWGAPLFPYQDLVATMAHELAHIAEQNHGPVFYQVMAQIERQRLEFIGRGLVLDEAGFPMGSMGHRLGSKKREVLGTRDLKRKVAESASLRQTVTSLSSSKIPSTIPQHIASKEQKLIPTDTSKRGMQLRAVEKRLGRIN